MYLKLSLNKVQAISTFKIKKNSESQAAACYIEDPLTFVDTPQSSVVHLIGAVEDHHVFTQTATHVFGGLCLSCTGGTGWGTSQGHTQGLSQGDVTSETQ